MNEDDKKTLLQDVKNHIDITWNDEEIDKKVNGYIKSGIAKINSLSGSWNSFMTPGIARDLLFTYCLYAFNKIANEFEINYLSDILKLQIASEVEEYEDR